MLLLTKLLLLLRLDSIRLEVVVAVVMLLVLKLEAF